MGGRGGGWEGCRCDGEGWEGGGGVGRGGETGEWAWETGIGWVEWQGDVIVGDGRVGVEAS